MKTRVLPQRAPSQKRAGADFRAPIFAGMPVKRANALYRTDEVASTIGRSHNSVRELIESGRLEAHSDSIFRGTRKTSLITRRSMVLYLAETSNTQSWLLDRIEELLNTFTAAQLGRVIATAKKFSDRIF